ncbi:hypothetical protein Afil01_61530 [Actinorhabdospora filicis]|uniref:Uncharacterized protein n=1 Tax=Actinorhabdospora filicis TaxID=1785913 RepID=A0A9W6SS12_9ACTN|nr:hypothetical protein Afil01_61530 [Actinorhabdospora filicis]
MTAVLGSRRRDLPAPPEVVWGDLMSPAWLELLEDEVTPAVLRGTRHSLVEWGSLWPDRPEDRVRFELAATNGGTSLRWTLTTTGEKPGESRIGHLRYRMNLLVHGVLRGVYGQLGVGPCVAPLTPQPWAPGWPGEFRRRNPVPPLPMTSSGGGSRFRISTSGSAVARGTCSD